MKMNAPRRQIVRDAVDLIPHPEVLPQTGEVHIPIAQIRPYHNHMFHLYEGERLNDMVESIRANGVLNPVIVRTLEDGHYEMLAGHNRMNASKLAGLTTVPRMKHGSMSWKPISIREVLMTLPQVNRLLFCSFSTIKCPTKASATILPVNLPFWTAQ